MPVSTIKNGDWQRGLELITVKVLETCDSWFGVTYKEDKPVVAVSFAKLIADGVYKEDLYSDLK